MYRYIVQKQAIYSKKKEGMYPLKRPCAPKWTIYMSLVRVWALP